MRVCQVVEDKRVHHRVATRRWNLERDRANAMSGNIAFDI
jgi:hypothetical protein